MTSIIFEPTILYAEMRRIWATDPRASGQLPGSKVFVGQAVNEYLDETGTTATLNFPYAIIRGNDIDPQGGTNLSVIEMENVQWSAFAEDLETALKIRDIARHLFTPRKGERKKIFTIQNKHVVMMPGQSGWLNEEDGAYHAFTRFQVTTIRSRN